MSALALRGVTITLAQVSNFHELSHQEAKSILYNSVIPTCESKGVFLSSYGNHVGQGSLTTVEKYNAEKAEHKLFDVERVQSAFAGMLGIIERASTYKVGSYGLKHVVEKHQGEYLTNGDLIAAMLLHGFEARFGKRTEQMNVNCDFKAKVKQ